MSSIDQNGDEETLTTLCLHLLLILIEYKPPSIDNLKYLIEGGHQSLNQIYMHHLTAVAADPAHATPQQAEAVLDDLTSNEHFRLLRVVHGKVNLDPIYVGLRQYFKNIVDCHGSYLPGSMVQIPFYQEVCVFAWRLITNN